MVWFSVYCCLCVETLTLLTCAHMSHMCGRTSVLLWEMKLVMLCLLGARLCQCMRCRDGKVMSQLPHPQGAAVLTVGSFSSPVASFLHLPNPAGALVWVSLSSQGSCQFFPHRVSC
jgi:hypothetical protein